jgi:hypothetical protein
MRIFGGLLAVIIIIAVIYSAVIWVIGEIDFSETFSRRPGFSSVRERSSAGEPSVSVRQEDDGRVALEFEKPSGPTKEIPAGFTEDDISPDFGKVEIASVRRPSSLGAGGGFTLRADTTLSESLDITNWRIKSNRGEITVRGGVSSVPPVNMARIVLRPRTSAVFYADINSFVKNVELNKCTGYLNNTYTLNPKLPNNCPRPERGDYINFSGECQNFIRSLSSCEQPTSSELNRFTRSSDIPCHEFLERLNYANCVREHSGDSNFYSYGWRIWMSERLPFDPQHDRLLLFDESGLLVDEYVY